MRVLLVTNDYPPRPGGIQQYLANLVAHSRAEFRVLAPAGEGTAPEPGVVRDGRRFMWPTRRIRRWVEEHVRDFAPAVVLFGAPHPLAALGPGLTARRGIPYAVIAHGGEITLPAALPGARQALRRILRGAALVLTVSEFTARRVRKIADVDAEVLGAGVDLEAFRPEEPEQSGSPAVKEAPLTLGCISRFVPRKGHRRVIRAAERLAAAGRPVQVLLAGEGRLESRLRRQAKRAAVPVRVETGVSWKQLPALYRQCDIFAMPSRSRWLGLETEGLGIVYLEAAACGRPVIAGTSGGSPETVVPGVTGLVASSPRRLAEAVEIIAAQREKIGQAARRRAEERYSWQQTAHRLDTALKKIVTS